MNSDILKGQWKQLVGQAKSRWGKLTDDDWLRIEGDSQRLAGIVQERYGITREQAEHEVKSFLDGHPNRDKAAQTERL